MKDKRNHYNKDAGITLPTKEMLDIAFKNMVENKPLKLHTFMSSTALDSFKKINDCYFLNSTREENNETT